MFPPGHAQADGQPKNIIPPAPSIHRATVTRFHFISMPAGFHRHLVGKSHTNVCYSVVT